MVPKLSVEEIQMAGGLEPTVTNISSEFRVFFYEYIEQTEVLMTVFIANANHRLFLTLDLLQLSHIIHVHPYFKIMPY